MSTIAITGTSGFIGSMLLRALVAERPRATILAIDRQPPECPERGYRFLSLDLTDPEAGAALAAAFRKHRCTTVVHAAVPTQPRRDVEATHELLSIGTMHLLIAAEKARVRHYCCASTTDVYGAFPTNPNFLTERHALRGAELGAFLRDKVDVEKQFLRHQQKHPKDSVTILRPCTILGPTIHNYKTHYLQHPIIPTVMGYDPLVQFVHESDVVRAFRMAIAKRVRGTFNLVGHGVLPLSRALAMAQRIRIPIASPLLRVAGEICWQLDLSEAPPTHLNFLQYPCVADGAKARRELGFTSVYSSQEALLSFVHAHRTQNNQ